MSVEHAAEREAEMDRLAAAYDATTNRHGYGPEWLERFEGRTGTTPDNWLVGARQGAIPSTPENDGFTSAARLLLGPYGEASR